MNYFRRICGGINVQPLLDQILSHPELWNADTDWAETKRTTVLYGKDSIVLRVNKTPRDRPAFDVLTEARSIVDGLIGMVHGVVLGNVVISRLAPGDEIKRHIDLTPMDPLGMRRMPPFYQRYQIPLLADPGVRFLCGDEDVEMRPGEIWWFNNQALHSVVNDSGRHRISMRADIRSGATGMSAGRTWGTL